MNFLAIPDTKDYRFNQCLMIYRSSFPDNERQRDDVIISRIDAGKAVLYAGEYGDEVVCIGLVWTFNDSRFALLDYFAVAKGMRGKGVGSEFMRFILDMVTGPGRTLVMEVEHPEYGDNTHDRIARINFYKRNGGRVIENVRYLLPPLGPAPEPLEMQLMFAPARNDLPTAAEIRDLILLIYSQVYGRQADDALLKSFLGRDGFKPV